ncbi:DUF975 family protein [Feifania hominis]|uniref:DUF975 family protein n=1 Tax=Feifania hominis TaxID=2763660 RepID=A0A926DG16_9FIRM|nr:DUF975 family protein [Feifania hominis]MBC8536370.1 DUF975 family protein [Feifania hominis]
MADQGVVRRNIKRIARRCLNGYYFTGIAMLLTHLLILLGITAVQNTMFTVFRVNLFTVENIENLMRGRLFLPLWQLGLYGGALFVISLIVLPLSFGICEWHYHLTDENPGSFVTLFNWYGSAKLYFKCLALRLNVVLRLVFWGSIPVAAGVFSAIFVGRMLTDLALDPLLGGLITGALILVTAVALVWFLIFTRRYAMCDYLLVRDPDKKIRQIIRESCRFMRGHKLEHVVFTLSFFGWFLLVALTFGLSLIFTMPYLRECYTVFYNYCHDTHELRMRRGDDTASAVPDEAPAPPAQPQPEPAPQAVSEPEPPEPPQSISPAEPPRPVGPVFEPQAPIDNDKGDEQHA